MTSDAGEGGRMDAKGDRIGLPPMPMMEFERYGVYGPYSSINGEDLRDDEDRPPFLEEFIIERLADLRKCPYCSSRIDRAGWGFRRSTSDTFARFNLRTCPYCGYWQLHEKSFIDFPFQPIEWNAFLSRARCFDSSLGEGSEA